MSDRSVDQDDLRLVTGSVPVVQGAGPPTGQQAAIKVVGRGRRRVTVVSVLLFVVAAAISFLVVGQLRGPDEFRQQLGTESEGDLARILASLSSESTNLQEELASLKVDVANAKNSSQERGDAAQADADQLRALQVLAATTPVTGPGLELVIDDPHRQVTYDGLVDTVQELRDAGAEALTVNGRRIGVTSSFGKSGDNLTLDGDAILAPFDLSAIGPADTMEGGIKIPGGALDTLRAFNGVSVDVRRSSNLQMPALDKEPEFHSARPVTP
jgi:uncharacterized protein YlxW (UPF0749 family)